MDLGAQIIQIIIVVFTLFFLSRVILRYKDKRINLGELLFWTVLWTGVIILAVFPNIITFVGDLFGVSRPLDYLVYLSIIALFYLVFRLYVKIHNMNQEVTKIVRHEALKKK